MQRFTTFPLCKPIPLTLTSFLIVFWLSRDNEVLIPRFKNKKQQILRENTVLTKKLKNFSKKLIFLVFLFEKKLRYGSSHLKLYEQKLNSFYH